jgi:hypothetical protein
MLRTTLLAFVLFAPSFAAADSSPKAIKADYDTLCNARERSGAAKESDISRRAELLAKYLETHLKTPEVKKFFGNLHKLPPGEAGPALKKAAADAGYKGACPMADAK